MRDVSLNEHTCIYLFDLYMCGVSECLCGMSGFSSVCVSDFMRVLAVTCWVWDLRRWFFFLGNTEQKGTRYRQQTQADNGEKNRTNADR